MSDIMVVEIKCIKRGGEDENIIMNFNSIIFYAISILNLLYEEQLSFLLHIRKLTSIYYFKSFTPLLQAQAALSAIEACAKSGDGNLMSLSIEAARARCSVGEISDAMEKVFGRHIAESRMVSGAYKNEYGESNEIGDVLAKVEVRCMNCLLCINHQSYRMFQLRGYTKLDLPSE